MVSGSDLNIRSTNIENVEPKLLPRFLCKSLRMLIQSKRATAKAPRMYMLHQARPIRLTREWDIRGADIQAWSVAAAWFLIEWLKLRSSYTVKTKALVTHLWKKAQGEGASARNAIPISSAKLAIFSQAAKILLKICKYSGKEADAAG